jgi:hypothetical protein
MVDESDIKLYGAVLSLDVEDEERNAVFFGALSNPGVTGPDGIPFPGQLVIPRHLWDNNGRPDKLTALFTFGVHPDTEEWIPKLRPLTGTPFDDEGED